VFILVLLESIFIFRQRRALLALLCAMILGSQARGQNVPSQEEKAPNPVQTKQPDDNSTEASAAPRALLKNLARDQKAIWTSPFKARIQDLNWLVPVAGLTLGTINADAEISSRINQNGTLGKRSGTISNAGVVAIVGVPSALYLMGKIRSDDHQREAGILAGEAAVNSFVVVEALKFATQRERPLDGSGQGRFYHSSSLTNSAFPSAHTMLAFSVASVLAHEYPGITTKILAYGFASGVGVARLYGKNHFTSDVLVSSIAGYMIGEQVYGAHHDRTLPGGGWGTFHHDRSPETGGPVARFSPYVPIDSWVYAAFDRLIALNVIHSGFQAMRPWTRAECARLLEEAEVDDQDPGEAARLYKILAAEFATELSGSETNFIGIDSVYARAMSISGPPLTDGYHFNKTIAYDYGRPYERGMNYLGGFTGSASAGALGFYVRAEYEHAPSAPGVSQSVQDAIQVADGKTLPGGAPIFQPATPIAAFNRPKVIEAYVSLNIKGWQASFGKQSLWTGPTRDPFMFTNNAEPLYMLRIDQTSPRKLPSFLGFLGPYRTQLFFGRVSGQHYVNPPVSFSSTTAVSLGRSLAKQPLIHGEQISFKPTPNFEFGVGVTTLWGGVGIPINFAELRRTLLTFTNPTDTGVLDPGDRRSFFNWSYRVPGLRNWLTIYQDSFAEDEFSPIGYPRRSAQNPGIYMPQLPMLPHMDFRFEGGYTALPGLIQPAGGGFFYWNVGYLDGYTNKGNIIGNTIGREGISLRAATTYWVASDKTIQLSYRNEQADTEFLKGGNLRDITVHSEWMVRPGISLTSLLQYEWWNYPLLTLGNKQTNFTASFQVTYWPHWKLKEKEEAASVVSANSRASRRERQASAPGSTTSSQPRPAETSRATLGVMPPVLIKAFGSASIPLNGTTSLTFAVSNPNETMGLANMSFTDVLPNGLQLATPPNVGGSCITARQGSVTARSGGHSITLLSLRLGQAESCVITVDVIGVQAGTQTSASSPISATYEDGSGSNIRTSGTTAQASVVVTDAGSPH